MDSLLFDLDSTFSYMFVNFSMGWDLDWEYLDTPIYVSTQIGMYVCVD